MTTVKLPSLHPLLIESIIWLEGEGNYSWANFSDGHCCLLTHTLKRLESQLPTFLRIRRSASINPAHVLSFRRIDSRYAYVILSNGIKLSISRRRINMVESGISKVELGHFLEF
jgi:DNA-binding LytR/AlgR family response regulator